MTPFRKALIVSTVLTAGGGAFIVAETLKPGSLSILAPIASVLFYPSALVWHFFRWPYPAHYEVVLICVQWLIWFAMFSIVFWIIHEWRRSQKNSDA